MKILKIIKISVAAAIVLYSGSCADGERSLAVQDQPNPEQPAPAVLGDAEILHEVQKQTIRYFWDYAETTSGMAGERYHTDNPGMDAHVVTTGGSGFGMLNLLIAAEKGFIPRTEITARLTKNLEFLSKADRFHGAWPHWLDGRTGKTIPFSTIDNGGDLVETAFVAQALICVREYFKNSADEQEKQLSIRADALWQEIEWSWYTQGQQVLYWHWSPQFDFQMDHQLRGYDETLITYILAAASPGFSINKSVYEHGWARSGAIRSNDIVYNIPTEVKHNVNSSVGPMFWSHYSFLALDPRGLRDGFVDYEAATRNHARIMHQYAVENPKKWLGYSAKNWGLTASYSRKPDGTTGYAAHSPSADVGVISPTAAISSIVFTPAESLQYLRFLYNENKNELIGPAGPYDAYSLHYNWRTPRYLAVDQGTMSPMIENYRSGFIWNLFMNAPEIRQGLRKLGFISTQHNL